MFLNTRIQQKFYREYQIFKIVFLVANKINILFYTITYT